MMPAYTKEEVLKRAYIEAESNENGGIPDSPEIQKLIDAGNDALAGHLVKKETEISQ